MSGALTRITRAVARTSFASVRVKKSILEKEGRSQGNEMMLLAGFGWLAHQGELINPRNSGSAQGAVDRLPADPIFAHTGDDIRRRRRFPVLPHTLCLNQPPVAVLGPVSVAKAPL